jgi:hypothetical protein
MPSSPPPEPEGQLAFPSALQDDFLEYLEGIANRGIFSQAKKAIYKKWLENPHGELEGDTPEERAADANHRNRALRSFQLVEGCIYRKAEVKKGISYQARYVALDSNAFDIICKEHRYLLHFG